MKIPKFLKALMALFICIALIRAVNDAGEISIYNILLRLQTIEFDISGFEDIIAFFKNGNFSTGFGQWNNNLKGIEGFIENLKTVLVGFFTMLGNLIKVFVVGLWKIFVEIFKLLGDLLNLVLYVTGFKKS